MIKQISGEEQGYLPRENTKGKKEKDKYKDDSRK